MKKIVYILIIYLVWLIPRVADAGSPMQFDQWTASSGNINSSACSAGYTCGSGLTDQGFLQRAVHETSTGKRYFQTIIVENNSTGAAGSTDIEFSDESFVAIGRGTYGLADKQHINGSLYDGNVNFTADNTILTGWATARGKGKDVEFDFNTVVALGYDSGVEGKNQTFDYRQRIADTFGSLDMGLAATLDPVAYASGSAIRALWFNQMVPGDQMFGYQQYVRTGSWTWQDAFSFTTYAPFDSPNHEIADPFNTTL